MTILRATSKVLSRNAGYSFINSHFVEWFCFGKDTEHWKGEHSKGCYCSDNSKFESMTYWI